MNNVDGLLSAAKAAKILRINPDFTVFMRYFREVLEGDRIALETAKPDLIQLTQGRITAIRELIGLVDGAEEIEKGVEEMVNQGESE